MKINFVSSSSLILANLYPIYGVYFLGWGVPKIILLYFIETLIISIFGFLKGFYIFYQKQKESGLLFLIFFYIFWLGSVFVALDTLLFFEKSNIYNSISLIGVFLMIVSHGVSFYTNFIMKKEYENDSIFDILGIKIFWLRVAPMHLFVFFSYFLLDSTVGPILISLFILSKTSIDLLLHIYEHSK